MMKNKIISREQIQKLCHRIKDTSIMYLIDQELTVIEVENLVINWKLK